MAVKKEKKSVSIVMVSYHTGSILIHSIELALSQDSLLELILVDNGNPEETNKHLYSLAKNNTKLKIITGHGNVGFAKGCNIGAKESSGKYLLILNPDCLLPDNTLNNAIKAMNDHSDVWLAGCQLLRPDGSLQGGSKRNILTPSIAFMQTFKIYRIFNSSNFKSINIDEDKKDTAPNANSYNVPAISGAFMFMELDKYLDIGGMDEGYFFHVEDLDLCKKINDLGGNILYIPSIRVTHYCSSSDVSSFFVEKNKTNGFIRYFSKHYKENSKFGLYYLIIICIYLRMILRMIPFYIKNITAKRRKKSAIERNRKQITLIEKTSIQEPLHELDSSKIGNILLTGSTGQVGLNILGRLLSNNIHVCAMYHNHTLGYIHDNLSWIQGDMEGAMSNSLYDRIKKHKPEILIHTPAIWYLPDNIEKFAELGIKRIICFSSTSIEGKSSSDNKNEKELVQKFIDAERILAEKCTELGIKYTIFRPTMIYGSGLDKNVSSIVRFINAFGFFPVTGNGKGLRQPVHTDDLASATIKVINNPSTHSQIYNLSGGTKLSYYDMINKICSVMGKKGKIISSPILPYLIDISSIIMRKKHLNGEIAKRMSQDLTFDHSQATRDFEYKPRDFLSNGINDLGIK